MSSNGGVARLMQHYKQEFLSVWRKDFQLKTSCFPSFIIWASENHRLSPQICGQLWTTLWAACLRKLLLTFLLRGLPVGQGPGRRWPWLCAPWEQGDRLKERRIYELSAGLFGNKPSSTSGTAPSCGKWSWMAALILPGVDFASTGNLLLSPCRHGAGDSTAQALPTLPSRPMELGGTRPASSLWHRQGKDKVNLT